jgi:thioesterase domain-containing protein
MDERALPDYSVAAIARRNVAALRAVDATGPYRLLGFSFGGTVALEMARQLEQAGASVELALLEPSLGSGRGGRVAAEHPRKPRTDAVTRLAKFGRRAVRSGRRQVYLASTGVVVRRGQAQHDLFLQHHSRLLRRHTPAPFAGPALVFGSERYLETLAPILDRLLPPEAHGGRRRDVVVPGEHLDLVREPNVAEVARVLDGWFAERERAQTWQAEQ